MKWLLPLFLLPVAIGYMLQQNSNLATANWTDLAGPVKLVGDAYQVSISLPTGNQFFQLQ